jgi:hypothetical protein
MDLGPGLDEVENILDPTGTRNPTPLTRPARSQSLYRLRHSGSRGLLGLLKYEDDVM